MKRKKHTSKFAYSLLRRHFKVARLPTLVVATRQFPATARVDLQRALDAFFAQFAAAPQLSGIHPFHQHETVTFSHLATEGQFAPTIGPLEYDEIEFGEPQPARCLKNGLWLCRDSAEPLAVFLTRHNSFGNSKGILVAVAVRPGPLGLEISGRFFEHLEKAIAAASSYRGKVLSLEEAENYSGRSNEIRVHRLREVRREEVILPPKTLELLERNVTQFVQQRDQLRQMGMPVKKGLLFYGPPGTGKTHTIHYLASQMPEHTTLLITADQMGLLEEYIQLARFLQPATVVIEDADLIARSRGSMRNACEESLLNRLLNEMDGLREDAMILFILTTNAPESLESALAGRPGRIDQAIEFPLPDDDGRLKLVKLYARTMEVPDDVARVIVRKTRNASAAFIKELMRRSAQYLLHDKHTGPLSLKYVEAALDEMLFSGGSLNVKLLGGAAKAE